MDPGSSDPHPDEKAPALSADLDQISGARKAAVLLISIGVEAASDVLARMSDEDVEAVSIEIARTENIAPDVVEAVLQEYGQMHMAQDHVTQGGKEFAEQALREAVGPERAEELMMQIEAATEVSGFHQLQTADIDQLAPFIRGEHPQTAALIFAHIRPQKAAAVLGELSEELQAEIVYRLANMDKTSPEFIEDVEQVLKQKMDTVLGTDLHQTGGAQATADILNALPRSAERNAMSEIEARDPELADRIRDIMFVFDDLAYLSNRDLQILLMEVEQDEIALALKAAPDRLEQKIYQNLSSRVQEMVREEVELLGRVRVSDVDEAQNAIMEVARSLQNEDEITLARENQEFIE